VQNPKERDDGAESIREGLFMKSGKIMAENGDKDRTRKGAVVIFIMFCRLEGKHINQCI